MEEEEVEAARVGADKLGERPVEGSAAADGGVRVTLERRLVHRHHHPRRRRRICHCSARTHACSLGLPSSARRRGVLGENFEQRTKGKRQQGCSISFFSSHQFARSTLSINKTICIWS